MALLSDKEINDLVVETKHLLPSHFIKTALKQKGVHKERTFEIIGDNGNRFCVIIRVSSINALAFSVILGLIEPTTGAVFRLRRYDGKSHEHTNKIEKEKFYDFHVHFATERYQGLGLDEDTFAKVDNRFADYHEALLCLFNDCGFAYPAGSNLELFGDGLT